MPAVTDPYATHTDYDAILGKTNANQDTQIDADLLAMSRYLDKKLGRFFTQDAAAVARIVYPRGYHGGDPEAENPWRGIRGARILDLPFELAALPTSVIIDLNRQGTFTGYAALTNPTDAAGVVGGDYQMWPLNAGTGPEPKPWTQLYIPTWSAQFGWPAGCMVQVLAKGGWPAVPNAIKSATVQLTAILRTEGPRATARVPEAIDGVIQSSPAGAQIIAELMAAYKRERIYA